MPVRVLLIDDNPLFLDAARGLLEREGFTVVGFASTAAEALEVVADESPDVVLVDVDLGRESGFDLAERLVKAPHNGPRPRIVLISSYAHQDLADLIDASPAVGFVTKAELSGSAIRRLLD